MPLGRDLLWALVESGGVLAALTTYVVTQRHAWATERGIRPITGWPIVWVTQNLTALTAAAYIHHTWGTGPAVAAAAFVWLGVLAVFTDLGSRKIPFEVPLYLVAPVGVAAFALNYTIEGILAFISATLGIVGVPLVVRWLTHKGLGASDIRLLWAASATCSWWLGQTWLLYALIAASLLQLIVHIIGRPLGWGTLVETHPDREPEPGKPVAMRREYPFAPALVTALFAFIIYGTTTAYGACHMWNVLGYCG